jgi:Transposase DDE domain
VSGGPELPALWIATEELLLPPSLREWLREDHLAWFVLEAVAELDLGAFYNAQAVTTEAQIVVAAELTTDGADFQQLEPMIATAERELERAGVKEKPGVVRADAGYWSNGHIDSLRERGIVPIVAPDTTRDKPRKTRLGGPYDFMRRASPQSGAAPYTRSGSGWSSRSSPRSRRTAASTASNAGDWRPPARSGA